MSFGLTTTLFAEASVPLPGNDRYWPQTVRANDKEVAVTQAGGLPVVRLSPGVYDIKGSVTWQQRPDGLSVPRHWKNYGDNRNWSGRAVPTLPRVRARPECMARRP